MSKGILDRLELRKNRALFSRIHRRLTIGPMTCDDTAEYIRMRLQRVGCDRELFASDAIALLHEAAGSSLRELMPRRRPRARRDGHRDATSAARAPQWPSRPRHRPRTLCDGHRPA